MGGTGYNNNEIRTTDIEGDLKGLMGELAALAPHPDRPDHSGPLFINERFQFSPPQSFDHIPFGYSELSLAFAGASMKKSGNTHHLVNLLGSGEQSLKRCFQGHAGSPQSEAFIKDLPKRLALEAWISHLQRLLYTMRKNALRLECSKAA